MKNDEKWEVISTYTDAQAVEDGVLVEVGSRYRLTGAAWEFLSERLPIVEPMDIHEEVENYAVMLFGKHEEEARRVYEHNIGGGIFTLELFGRKLWMMPNELGGLTLMLPEDY